MQHSPGGVPEGATRNLRTVWAIGQDIVQLRDDLTDEQLALLEECFEPQGEDGWLKDVWAINPKGSPLAHYAMFPPALVRPIIRACCPERCCAKCGAPWVRQVEKHRGSDGRARLGERHGAGYAGARLDHRGKAPSGLELTVNTVGFAPSCKCPEGTPTRPGVVLDPFSGMATAGVVAIEEGRGYVGIELNPEYAERSRRRLASTTPTMFGAEDNEPTECPAPLPLFTEAVS